MPCYAIDGVKPVVSPDSYVHPTATLIGDVIVDAGCYIGPSACLRGDFGRLQRPKPCCCLKRCSVFLISPAASGDAGPNWGHAYDGGNNS